MQNHAGYSEAKLAYSHPEASGLYSEAYTQVGFLKPTIRINLHLHLHLHIYTYIYIYTFI